jgi:hypothetical protein
LRVRRQSPAKAIAPQPSGARRRGDQAAEVNVTKQPDGGPTFHHSTVAGLAVFKTTNRLASVRLAVLDRCRSGMAPLFRATVRYLGAAAHRRRGIEICHFVAFERENARLRAVREIRERASLDVDRKHVGRFIDRVGAEIGCTIALFSSGVPLMRLFEANLSRSERTTVIENLPLASAIIVPFGLGP